MNWVGKDGLETTCAYCTHNEEIPVWSFTLNFWLFSIGSFVDACTDRKWAIWCNENAGSDIHSDHQSDLKVTYLLMSSCIYSESSCLGMLKDNVHSSICSRTSIHLLSTVWNLYTLHTGFLNTEREWQRQRKKEYWTIWRSRKYSTFSSKIIQSFSNLQRANRGSKLTLTAENVKDATERNFSKGTRYEEQIKFYNQ